MELLLSNMYAYKQSVPEHINFIYDIETNPHYLEEFNDQIYKTISRIPYKIIDSINNCINPWNSISNNDMFLTFKMNRDNNSVDIIAQSEYVKGENFPFHFNLIDDGIVCDFIDPTSFENKLINSPNRYISFDVDFVSDIQKAGHSILIIFDTKTRTCFLLDSNGSLSYFNHPELGIFNTDLIHKTMEFYSGLLSYKYIKLGDLHINFKPNYKINSQFQKSFFIGYCKGWTLFFQYLLLVSPYSFEFVEFIKNFQQTDNQILNQLVEIFQVWYYRSFNLDKIRFESKSDLTSNPVKQTKYSSTYNHQTK